MSQAAHSLRLKDTFRAAWICVCIDGCAATSQPSKHSWQENCIGTSTAACIDFCLRWTQTDNFLGPWSGKEQATTIENHAARNTSARLPVACPVAVSKYLQHIVTLADVRVPMLNPAIAAIPFQRYWDFTVACQIRNQMLQNCQALLGRLWTICWQMATNVLAMWNIIGRVHQDTNARSENACNITRQIFCCIFTIDVWMCRRLFVLMFGIHPKQWAQLTDVLPVSLNRHAAVVMKDMQPLQKRNLITRFFHTLHWDVIGLAKFRSKPSKDKTFTPCNK